MCGCAIIHAGGQHYEAEKAINFTSFKYRYYGPFVGLYSGDGKHTADKPAGFFWGIWHGWLAPLSLIIGIFVDNIRVYEVMNTGWWYDLGFYMAIISGFGGLSFARRRSVRVKHKSYT